MKWITILSKNKEEKLFQLFKEKDGLDLYEEVKLFIEKEKQDTAKSQIDKRHDFISKMLNIWNNTGWDDKNDWSRKLDVIRGERSRVEDDAVAYNINED